MRQLSMMIFMLAMLMSSRLAADEWLGLEEEQPVLIGFDLARDEVTDLSRAFTLSLPLGSSAGYNGYYSATSVSDEQQKFDSLVLATLVWFQLTELVDIEVRHFFEGSNDELEKETLGIGLGLNRGNWNARLHLDEGELLIFTRDDISDFLSTFVPDRFASDVTGAGLALGWQSDPWYWQASYQHYDYERNLAPLERSIFAQFIVKSSALAQSSLLISQNISFLVGHADLENDYSILISQDESAIDQSISHTLVLSWQHWASQRLGYLLAASLPSQSDSIGLTLGLRWVL